MLTAAVSQSAVAELPPNRACRLAARDSSTRQAACCGSGVPSARRIAVIASTGFCPRGWCCGASGTSNSCISSTAAGEQCGRLAVCIWAWMSGIRCGKVMRAWCGFWWNPIGAGWIWVRGCKTAKAEAAVPAPQLGAVNRDAAAAGHVPGEVVGGHALPSSAARRSRSSRMQEASQSPCALRECSSLCHCSVVAIVVLRDCCGDRVKGWIRRRAGLARLACGQR